MIDVGQRDSACNGNATLILLLENNVGGLLVNSDTKPFQFSFDDLLVDQGLVHVEDNENEVAGLGYGNDLSTTTFTILGTLNNTRKIENLDFGAVVHHLSGHGCQSCEFVGRGCRRLLVNPTLTHQAQFTQNKPSECWPVNLLIRVLLPTEGNPMKPLSKSISISHGDRGQFDIHTRNTSTGNIETS